MNWKWLIGLVLLAVLVQGVSATTLTVYPNSSSDAYSYIAGTNQTWAALHDAATATTSSLTGTTLRLTLTSGTGDPDKYNELYRGIIIVDSSTLPDNAIITGARIGLFKNYVGDGFGHPFVNIVKFNIDGTISSSDFDRFDYTPYSSDVNVSSASTSAYTVFELNSVALENISKTGDTGFGVLLNWDYTNTPPAWQSNKYSQAYFNSSDALVNIPYVEIDYIIPTISTYPVLSPNSTKILPNSDTNLPSSGSSISVNASAGEFEQLSFVIKPTNTTITGITISSTTPSDGLGHTIPTSAINIRELRSRYQSRAADISNWAGMSNNLQPELLLKNSSTISCNYTTQICGVWVSNATAEGYMATDNTTIAFPSDGKIYDNATISGDMQTFTLPENENRQIWLTVDVPDSQTTGNYTFKVWINATESNPTSVDVTLRVLPFTLENSSLEYGMYYTGYLTDPATTPGINTVYISRTQMLLELQNLYDHGVTHPQLAGLTTFNRWWINESLDFRDTVGFPKDNIYVVRTINASDLSDTALMTTQSRGYTEAYGYTNTYLYGEDEASGATLTAEIPAMQQVHTSGGKVFASGGSAGKNMFYDYIGSVLDLAVQAGAYNNTDAARWHSTGSRIVVYANPESGVEDFETYRENYGFALWVSDYDGTQEFAYHFKMGDNIWNDYDYVNYRDHVFAYPTSNGVIDTIGWEGWREAVDDSRYADTLSNITGNTTEATAIINAGIADGVDMSVIRGNLIDAILDAMSDPPVANFTATPTSGNVPLLVQFNDTSTYPVTYAWYIDDNTTPFSTAENPAWTFTGNQTYTIRLNVSNTNGFDWENKTAYISGLAVTPVAAFSGTPLSGTTTVTTVFTDASTNTPTAWSWYLDGNTTAFATTRNSTITLTAYAGTAYDIRLNASNAGGFDWENKTGYVVLGTDITKQVCISDSSTGNVTSALNTIGIMLVVVGMIGILYSLLGAGGITGGRSNYGGSGNVNGMLIVASILAILVGAVMLVMAYFIIGSAMGMSVSCL